MELTALRHLWTRHRKRGHRRGHSSDHTVGYAGSRTRKSSLLDAAVMHGPTAGVRGVSEHYVPAPWARLSRSADHRLLLARAWKLVPRAWLPGDQPVTMKLGRYGSLEGDQPES